MSILAPSVLTNGHVATMSGTLSTGQANQKLEILAQQCGNNNAKVVATVTTTTAGAYTHQVQPALLPSYQARFKPPQAQSRARRLRRAVRRVRGTRLSLGPLRNDQLRIVALLAAR